jgi:hypothetical protein
VVLGGLLAGGVLVGVGLGAGGIGPAPLAGGLQVGPDGVGLLLGLAVAAVDQVLRGVAPAEAEGRRGGQRQRPDQRDVGGGDDDR